MTRSVDDVPGPRQLWLLGGVAALAGWLQALTQVLQATHPIVWAVGLLALGIGFAGVVVSLRRLPVVAFVVVAIAVLTLPGPVLVGTKDLGLYLAAAALWLLPSVAGYNLGRRVHPALALGLGLALVVAFLFVWTAGLPTTVETFAVKVPNNSVPAVGAEWMPAGTGVPWLAERVGTVVLPVVIGVLVRTERPSAPVAQPEDD